MIRPAAPRDADGLARVHVEAWRDAYRGLLPDEYLDRLSVDERSRGWRRRLAGPAPLERVVVAAAGRGGVIGFASVGPSRDDDGERGRTGELYAIYLLAEWWGGGTGRRLQAAALAELQAIGYREATLWALDTNLRARGFYERTGWTADGATKREEFGLPITEVRYRRSLEPDTSLSVGSRHTAALEGRGAG